MFCSKWSAVGPLIALLTIGGCQNQGQVYGLTANQRLGSDIGSQITQFLSNTSNPSFGRLQPYTSPFNASRPSSTTSLQDYGFKRTPGPGCVPFNTYAVNCQTSDEFRTSHGMPTVEQDREASQRAAREQGRENAALKADLARPVSANESAKSCADLQFQQVNVGERPRGESFGNTVPVAPDYKNVMTNNCSYDVQFKVDGAWGVRWVSVDAGTWKRFEDLDSWTGQVRRKK